MNYMLRWDCTRCGGREYLTPGMKVKHVCNTDFYETDLKGYSYGEVVVVGQDDVEYIPCRPRWALARDARVMLVEVDYTDTELKLLCLYNQEPPALAVYPQTLAALHLYDKELTTFAHISGTSLKYTTDTMKFASREKENEMSRIDSLLAQAEYIQKELEKETAKRLKYGEEPEDGRVLTFEYQFMKGGTWYSYAAVRARGLWNTTGPRSPKAYTWDELIDWWERGKVRKLRVVTKAEKLG